MKNENKKRILASCIKDDCGKQFDTSIPEKRDIDTLKAFYLKYCPKHRTAPKSSKRILSVTIKRMYDDSPDTSHLGEYASRPTSDEFSIDRAHSLDCIENDSIQKDKLNRIADAIENLQTDSDHESSPNGCHEGCTACVEETILECAANEIRELAECDCGERGNMERNEYRYFNPSSNYKGEPPQDVRKYTRQDYERMESLNAGNWSYIGIQTSADVKLRADVSDLFQTVTSGGLWGIESDSDKSYFSEVEAEQLVELRNELKALGFSARAISTAFKNVERKDA